MTAPILYVEDEEDYQLLVRRILRRAGLEIMVAETGKDGFQVLKRERPRLLILDVNLPDTNGYAICSQLRRDPTWIDLPILMLTVKRRPEEWLRGFSSGVNDYMSKPLNPPELIERVVNCLGGNAHSFRGSETAEYSLIRAAVSGNRAAFEILVQKYRERLTESIKNSVRNDAQTDDVVAHAFATAFERLREFRGEASFYTWVYRIALNESISVYRKPSAAVSFDELAEDDESLLLAQLAPQVPLEKIIADKTANRQALEALNRVPEPYREIIELFFLQDLSYDVISKKLHIPEGTVMSRLHRARKLLRDAWKTPLNKPA